MVIRDLFAGFKARVTSRDTNRQRLKPFWVETHTARLRPCPTNIRRVHAFNLRGRGLCEQTSEYLNRAGSSSAADDEGVA